MWSLISDTPSTSSQEPEEGFYPTCFLDERSSGRSRSRNIRGSLYYRGRPMEFSLLSPSGMMSEVSAWITRRRRSMSPSSAPSGRSLSSQEASPARTSRSQGRGRASKASVPGSGARCSETLARYDRGTSSWRTHQCLLFEDSTECLETFPKSGMTRSGRLYPLPQLEHLTAVTGSGSGGRIQDKRWPTPRAQEPGRTTEGYGRGLAELVEGKEQRKRRWPTPTCSDSNGAVSPERFFSYDLGGGG